MSEKYLIKNEQVIESLRNNEIDFKQLYYQFRNKKGIVLAALENKGHYLAYVSTRLKDDKDVVIMALTQLNFENLYTLQYASDRLKDDEHVVLNAVYRSHLNLAFASDRLKDDKDVMIEAVKYDVNVLYYASERLKDDKDVVLEAVKKDGYALYHASNRLKNDKELLELLEKDNFNYLEKDDKIWYAERMEVLALYKEKELMEKSITPSNKLSKKIKF